MRAVIIKKRIMTSSKTALPLNSKNAPTFRIRKDDSKTATRQLDFVFASSALD